MRAAGAGQPRSTSDPSPLIVGEAPAGTTLTRVVSALIEVMRISTGWPAMVIAGLTACAKASAVKKPCATFAPPCVGPIAEPRRWETRVAPAPARSSRREIMPLTSYV